MSDRKYRHRGYMDSDRDSHKQQPQSTPQSKPQDREGPRSPKMMGFGESINCAMCGVKTPQSIGLESTCPKCRADLHTCRQCTYFDPGAHFECGKPIPKKIVNKISRNTCELFVPRTVVERQTSSGPPSNARDAFSKLFKK